MNRDSDKNKSNISPLLYIPGILGAVGIGGYALHNILKKSKKIPISDKKPISWARTRLDALNEYLKSNPSENVPTPKILDMKVIDRGIFANMYKTIMAKERVGLSDIFQDAKNIKLISGDTSDLLKRFNNDEKAAIKYIYKQAREAYESATEPLKKAAILEMMYNVSNKQIPLSEFPLSLRRSFSNAMKFLSEKYRYQDNLPNFMKQYNHDISFVDDIINSDVYKKWLTQQRKNKNRTKIKHLDADIETYFSSIM